MIAEYYPIIKTTAAFLKSFSNSLQFFKHLDKGFGRVRYWPLTPVNGFNQPTENVKDSYRLSKTDTSDLKL